ncbi:dihydroneopterin aldolase [Microbacterium limosum]|uniref:7,8-dihydroneopterin aldolase n=1 Tax=Microbacterium limosum TaxID=3079935 RepID=A0AAU0MIS9_9MICO|nr:dihydroneopterin aldolase [Microbacterium sp. Y20]WOQ69874.1 dihydroneopterin aldolase [Microbacterium sp. Y20]
MSDTITLTGLRVFGRHGVYDHERADGQDFVIDAVFELDTRPAASSDDVVDTIHYGEAAQQIAEIVAGEPVALLETLAARIARALLADDRLDAVTVVVHKPQAPIPLSFADVSVSIRRERGAR